jgi:hypothetical protein
LGYLVFPCAPGTKKPFTPNGFHDATTDRERIEHWWTQQPRANIAIPTSGLVVIDIDGGNNGWLASEPEKKLELASAPTATTADARPDKQHRPNRKSISKRLVPSKKPSKKRRAFQLGTFIARCLKRLGIKQKSGCGCGQREATLNRLGRRLLSAFRRG